MTVTDAVRLMRGEQLEKIDSAVSAFLSDENRSIAICRSRHGIRVVLIDITRSLPSLSEATSVSVVDALANALQAQINGNETETNHE